jgi:hypothetical protein
MSAQQHDRGSRIAWAAALALLVGGGAFVAVSEKAGKGMSTAAQQFLASLSAEQRAAAAMPFDDPKRLDWHFFPKSQRKGLALAAMDGSQRRAAMALLRSALSQTGYDKAAAIMQLESVLHQLEKGKGSFARDADKYYFTIFGSPGGAGRWGLSIEGHHLSLNYVVEGDTVVSQTPAFFGANPAEAKSDFAAGPKKGARPLAREEQLALALLRSLSAEQAARAVIAEQAPRDIRGPADQQPPQAPPAGLPAKDMTPKQQKALIELIEAYTGNMPADIAAAQWKEIRAAGVEALHFAWAGARSEGAGHYYRIQGPTMLIEFCNVQADAAGNPANHIHTVYRSLKGDFAVERRK